MKKKNTLQKVARSGVLASNKLYFGNTKGSTIKTNLKRGRKVRSLKGLKNPLL
jgi:hypothetical protein